ncbi:MAG: acetolactate decarboxylase [Planctomycetes bacterium]|nr:acetolactate decarboxylase [Planctomycetota bacterium]
MTKLAGMASSVVLVAVGCASTPIASSQEPEAATAANWDGSVRSWGSLREVLRLGKTEARVDCAEAVSRAHAYGVGALEGVSGEILIRDGEVWVSRVVDGQGQTLQASSPGEQQATFLAVANVPGWHDVAVQEAVAAGDVDAFIAKEARRLGFDMAKPFPVVVEGAVSGLKLHVLNGACPFAAPIPPDSPQAPFKLELGTARGIVVGFYSEGPPGELTHHSSKTHLHVLVEGEEPQMGHVDSMGLQAGAVLRLPRVR